MTHTIGVDVGNFNTKSAHTDTVSGYTTYSNEQLLAEKSCLAYNGKYYVESIDHRFPFVEDKTENDQCLILTLFAIAKEILWRIENVSHLKGNGIQDAILNYNTINLGIGLPPGHFSKLATKTVDYYKNVFHNGIEYTYAGFKFSFKLANIRAYAQDLAAVVWDNSISITKAEGDERVPKYYIVGIGGYTVDVIPMNNGVPEVDNCRSLPVGTRQMFETIIARIQSSAGVTLDESSVENVLRNKRVFLKNEVKEEIFLNAQSHADNIISRCIQAGCLFDQYPVVFVGGGFALLSPFLKNNNKICYSEYIEDVHANAVNYELSLNQECSVSA